MNQQRKTDNVTVTTAVESLEDQIDYESNCEGKELSVRVNGILFRGIKSSTDSSHPCEMDGCNEILIGEEETLKERNRRLLRKERESVRQRKVRTSKRRDKCASCTHISQETEENNTASVEDPEDGKINGTVENISRQKETARVDRRWELELLSRMKEKLLNKTEKTTKSIVKRVVWGSNHIPKILLYIIRSYSSSAFRFAALKSNRSYKPGD